MKQNKSQSISLDDERSLQLKEKVTKKTNLAEPDFIMADGMWGDKGVHSTEGQESVHGE